MTAFKTQLERMQAGLEFDPRDSELMGLRRRAMEVCARYQAQPSKGHLKQVLSLAISKGVSCYFEPGIQFSYGLNLELANNVYANFNCVLLDSAKISLGENVMLGPGVHIYTVSHPVNASERSSGKEFAEPVDVGADVWIGGQSILMPGITIGKGSVVGAGSVVTKSVEPGVVVAGNPARVIRAC